MHRTRSNAAFIVLAGSTYHTLQVSQINLFIHPNETVRAAMSWQELESISRGMSGSRC